MSKKDQVIRNLGRKNTSQLKLYFLILLGAVILVGMLVVANIILAKRRSAS